jgi:hypothetical protein
MVLERWLFNMFHIILTVGLLLYLYNLNVLSDE